VLKGSRLLAALPTLGRPWTTKLLATEALTGPAKAPTGAQVPESQVAHRLIDLDSERHLHCHRYERIVHGRFTWRRRRARIQQHLISLCGLSLRL
jgi:hypothetical protein